MGRKVLIAMSGGVDSSVAAWLLVRQGWDCVGATMRLYDDETIGRRGQGCCSLDDVEDARSVARRLGIPYYVSDFRDQFREQVIRRFAEGYLGGVTPTPCIDCNRYLKFGALLHWARVLGIGYVATGHYARICLTPSTGRWAVRRGRDPDRDQSYFLGVLDQDQMAHTLFPLGGLHKSEVRRIAEANGFLNARKRDSQDLCFVPDGDHGAFLERWTGAPLPAGDILDQEGRVLGRHQGAARYTLGQRKGLGVSAGEPLYVCEKSMEAGTVTMGPDAALYRRSLVAGDWIWGAVPGLDGPVRATAKIRSRQQDRPATVEPMPDGRVRVTFDDPQRAIAPGQAVVLYQGDTVLGGGTIVEAV